MHILPECYASVVPTPTPEPDDILAAVRPDILPGHGSRGPEAGAPAAHAGDARMEHLRRVPLFADCTDDELTRIVAISRTVEMPVGTVVTEIGKPGDAFFFIVDGQVSVETPAGMGDPLKPGDFFGEMSLLDGEPRSATVTATTSLRLLVIDGGNFWRLLHDTPDLVRRIFKVLTRRVRRLEQAAYAKARPAR